jgi:hypothetical protein
VIGRLNETIANSDEVDTIWFVRSAWKEFGIHGIDKRWEIYRRATDSGLLQEIFEKAFGAMPDGLLMHCCRQLPRSTG